MSVAILLFLTSLEQATVARAQSPAPPAARPSPRPAGESTLQAVLSLRLKEGPADVPERLVADLVAYVQRTIRSVALVSTSKGPGRLVVVVSFPPDRQLDFEKMVVELPTASFSPPVVVESWNVSPRSGVGADPEAAAFANFKIAFEPGGGKLLSARLRDVPLKDVLTHLSRTSHLEYVCSREVGDLMVDVDVKRLSVDDLLKSLRLALGLDLTRLGNVQVLHRK